MVDFRGQVVTNVTFLNPLGSASVNIIDLIVGKPLKTSDERAEQIGPGAGVSIFGLDGLIYAA
jgi:hypothetical protein